MIIRKLYKIESAHIVKGAVSDRCSHSYHGHSGKIEVFLTANHLDNAGMVYDFGAMKETIGSFIDMFDHSVHLYMFDEGDAINFFKEHNKRYVLLPCNPTAENYAVLFRDCINEILSVSKFNNGEGEVKCTGVRYHETDTGYAESNSSDIERYSIEKIIFSPATIEEASPFMQNLIKTRS